MFKYQLDIEKLFEIIPHKMAQKDFNLSWHSFPDHLRGMMHDLKKSGELTDVTLVSEDKKQFNAHKIILSASSTFFESIVGINLMANQLIFLRGIHSNQLESILEFIYLGQATYSEDRVNEFLNVAKSLEIKGIIRNVDEKAEPVYHKNNEVDLTTIMEAEEDEFETMYEIEGKVSQVTSKNLNENEELIKCDKCDRVYVDMSSLNRHIKATHDGVKYPCDKCDYRAAHAFHLKQHKKSLHKGVTHSCSECGKKYKRLENLKYHKKIHLNLSDSSL